MQLSGEPKATGPKLKINRPAFALITLIPLVWLLTVTMTAGLQKIFHADPRIGFQSAAGILEDKLPDLKRGIESASALPGASLLESAEKALRNNRALRFNLLLDAVVTGIFLSMVVLIVALLLDVRSPSMVYTKIYRVILPSPRHAIRECLAEARK